MSVQLPCPVAGCRFTEEFVNELAAHLIATHDYERADAVAAAKKVQSQVDPFGLEKNGIKKHDVALPSPPAQPVDEEPAMPKPPRDPAACKVCARLAKKTPGAKCKRHGGAPHTGGGSRSKKKVKTPEPAVNGNSHGPVGDDVARQAGETYVGHLKRIRERLDGLISILEESLSIL